MDDNVSLTNFMTFLVNKLHTFIFNIGALYLFGCRVDIDGYDWHITNLDFPLDVGLFILMEDNQ